MALLLNEADILEDVFNAMDKWTRGVVPGGLAIGTTMSNGIFAALSGSTAAASAAIAKIAKPTLDSYGYKDTLSMGTIASSGTFAMMIPPSLGLIIYGVLTGTNIGRLFIGGIVPGILTLIAYILVILAWSIYDPSIAGESGTIKSFTWSERLSSSRTIWPVGLLIVMVLGSLYSGVVTPTEAGALGAMSALLIGIILYGVRMEELNNALTDTAEVTAYIFIVVIGATFFGRYIALEGVISDLLTFLTGLPLEDFGILLVVLLMYLILGMFINQLPILILTLPVTHPLFVEGFGYPAVWFGILIIKTVEIGMITPPIGINVYIASNSVDIDPSITFRGAARFIVADVIVLGSLLLFPSLVMTLPNSMG